MAKGKRKKTEDPKNSYAWFQHIHVYYCLSCTAACTLFLMAMSHCRLDHHRHVGNRGTGWRLHQVRGPCVRFHGSLHDLLKLQAPSSGQWYSPELSPNNDVRSRRRERFTTELWWIAVNVVGWKLHRNRSLFHFHVQIDRFQAPAPWRVSGVTNCARDRGRWWP